MKKVLIIGGTGNISLYVVSELLRLNHQVTLLNRGNKPLPQGVDSLVCDINNEQEVKQQLEGRFFDCIAQFITYHPQEAERDIRLFQGKTRQFLFIATAAAYQRPSATPFITEKTPLENPYWLYGREKIDCERVYLRAMKESGFPLTIVRPSHTYGDCHLPVAIHGGKGPWVVMKRILDNKPVLIPGDGTNLWTITHSEDFAQGFVSLMGRDEAIGQDYHITSDEALTWNQIYQTIAAHLGRTLNPCHVPTALLCRSKQYDYTGALWGDKSNCALFDNSKLKQLNPSFSCKVPFALGAERSIRHFLSNPSLQREDPAFDAFCDKTATLMQQAAEAIDAF